MEQYESKENYAIKDERLDNVIKEANLALNVDMERFIKITINIDLKENLKDIFKKLSDIYDQNLSKLKMLKKNDILYYIFYNKGSATLHFNKKQKYIEIGVKQEDIAYELYIFKNFYNKLKENSKEISITCKEFLIIYGFLEDLINKKDFNKNIVILKTYSAYSFFIKNSEKNRYNMFLKNYKVLEELYMILIKIKDALLEEKITK